MEKKNREIHQELIKRAKGGDQKAFYRLYMQYVQAIYNTCLRMLVNQLDAEDLVQETFISAFNNLKSFRGEASFGAWLKRIAINKSLNFLRKKNKNFKNIEEIQSSEYSTHEEEEDKNTIYSIAPEKIHEHIKSLPDKARVVLNLYLLENYKHKEVAEMLNISESTSKSQYIRARELLKERLLKEISYEI